jgi:predicted lipase
MRIGSFIIERTGYDTSGNVIYYIATNIQQNTTALVLRGSATREDLRLDLRSDVGKTNFSQVFEGLDMEKAQVHHGFWTRFMQFRRKIHTDVDAVLKRRNTTFVVVGHSLGAAWAFVHAADIAYNAKYPIYGAYVYGMPLVGNAEFADAMADIIGTDKVIRLVSKNDVVPHVGFLRGSHPTKVNEYFVEMDGVVPRVCDGGQDKTCSLKIPCRQWSWEHHSSVGPLSTRMEICRLENSPVPDALYH